LRWDAFDASLYVNNALNDVPIVVQSRDIYGSPLFFQRTLRPRTIGLTGTYRF
jgi:outer membrane receptor protein involved in Fe transport